MAGEMKQFVQTVLRETIQRNYPHMELPPILLAVITSATELGSGWYEYALSITDAAGAPDGAYPQLPGVRSQLVILAGKTVAVGLLFGALSPVILGEVVL